MRPWCLVLLPASTGNQSECGGEPLACTYCKLFPDLQAVEVFKVLREVQRGYQKWVHADAKRQPEGHPDLLISLGKQGRKYWLNFYFPLLRSCCFHMSPSEKKESPGTGFRVIHSINYIQPGDLGAVVLAGSHGGLYSGYKAVGTGVRGIVLNDAGVGMDNAGIAALDYCARFAMAAATVDSHSARIGDAADMLQRGVISHANAPARKLGIREGLRCIDALHALRAAAPSTLRDTAAQEEYRRELPVNGRRIVCIDSASLIQPQDAGQIVLTGSHGGLIGSDPAKAINVPAALAAFNDAGGGADDAGLGRLGPLQALAIAALTVGHGSARIGDALSTYETGVISHINPAAGALGARPGMRLKEFLHAWKPAPI